MVSQTTKSQGSKKILEFPAAEDADRMARAVGGPWMRENITPLLASDTERSLTETSPQPKPDGETLA